MLLTFDFETAVLLLFSADEEIEFFVRLTTILQGGVGSCRFVCGWENDLIRMENRSR